MTPKTQVALTPLTRIQPAMRSVSRPEPVALALLCTDLEGFTPLVERLGDFAARAVMRAHEARLTPELLDSAFAGALEPVPLKAGYRIGLALVAVTTVLLPRAHERFRLTLEPVPECRMGAWSTHLPRCASARSHEPAR